MSSVLPELTVGHEATTTVTMLSERTVENGFGWFEKKLSPNDGTSYFHVDGIEWQPQKSGVGRWFGNYKPENQNDARIYYNLPAENSATHIFEFKFDITESDPVYCIFGSAEAIAGHWQAKFPDALIPYVKVLKVIELVKTSNEVYEGAE